MRRRNPLFDLDLGISIPDTVTIDLMHTFHLGILNAFCKHIIWEMLLAGLWSRQPTQEECVQVNILIVAMEWKKWAKDHQRTLAPSGIKMSTFRISKKTFGDVADKKLALKAAQCWWFFLFLLDVLSQKAALVPGGEAMLAAGQEMKGLLDTLRASPAVPARPAVQKVWDHWIGFVSLVDSYLHLPKRHLAMHLFNKMTWFGNPTAYANWVDESLNRMLKLCCRNISQKTFESVVLQQMRYLLRPIRNQ